MLSSLRRWINRNQKVFSGKYRPIRLPQGLIRPALEGLEERTVPAVLFTYTGSGVTGDLAFAPDTAGNEFTLVDSAGEFRFRADSPYGNCVLVANASTVPVQGTPPPHHQQRGFRQHRANGAQHY